MKCKNCLNICDCCTHSKCDTCKPFGENFKLRCDNRCGLTIETKFKRGDKVRVINDLTDGSYYSMEGFDKEMVVIDEMLNFKGKVVTIDEVYENFYFIKEDLRHCLWSDGMFEDNKVE